MGLPEDLHLDKKGDQFNNAASAFYLGQSSHALSAAYCPCALCIKTVHTCICSGNTLKRWFAP